MPLSFSEVGYFFKVSNFAIGIFRNAKKMVVKRVNRNFQLCHVFSRNDKFLKKPMTSITKKNKSNLANYSISRYYKKVTLQDVFFVTYFICQHTLI